MSTVPTRQALAWAFLPYIALSVVHVVALTLDANLVAAPTKLLLMPALGFAVLSGLRDRSPAGPLVLLVTAIAFSWLGDGAGFFFAFAGDPLVPMLLFFGLAHIAYMTLFWRHMRVRRVPVWAAVYAIWWVALVVVLWPRLGGLAVAVSVYGVVLAGTATLASRCHALVAWGGAAFLASDTVLALRLFTAEWMPPWTSPLVMLTYTLGQGLIAAGVLTSLRSREAS